MRRAHALLVLAAAVATPATFAQQFTYDNTALPASTIWTDGVAIADVNGDGNNDILFANGQGYGAGGARAQQLLLGDGTGSFTDASANLNVANFNAKMVIAEDFDGDGDLDLMYAPEGAYPATTQVPRMLINQGGAQLGTEGVFANESATRIPNITMASFCVAPGDVDDDGDLDVVFTDGATFGGVATQARLYLNDGNGFFTNATGTNMPADTYNAQDVTLFDYDGDYDIDIALSGKGAAGKRARLYLNDGTGNFSISNAHNQLGSGATYEIDWGDLDGDGDFDAAVQSIAGASEGWGRNDGPNTTVPEATFPAPNGNDDNEMALMDYDNDGDLDVFVGSLASVGEKVYRNNGNSTFTNNNAAIQTISDSTLDFGFGDLDNDGDYDMVTGQGESGNFTNKVYVNGGPADTLPPTFLGVEVPAAVDPVETVFHAHIQDAISDDGTINASMTYDWVTDLSSGSGTAFHMGGGLFRATVPTAGALVANVTWTATDVQGNAATFESKWQPVGVGKAGVSGVPELRGSGPMSGGSTDNTVDLSNAAPNATVALYLSVTADEIPFKLGFLYPWPIIVTIFVATDAQGDLSFPLTWPTGVPDDFPIYWQYAIQDGAATTGISLSNATLSLSDP